MRQVSTTRALMMKSGPDIARLRGVVAAEVLDAMRAASAQLAKQGIRHALVGGLAVGAHGWARATRDVDFLIGASGFQVHGGNIVTFAPGVPLRVGNVAVDPLVPAPNEAYFEAAIEQAVVSEGIPILPLEALFAMKLRSPRRKDRVDLIELTKAGRVDRKETSVYLAKNAPDLEPAFRDVVETADKEHEQE